MLHITKTIEYSLIAIQHLNQKDKKNLSSAKEIASSYNIPYANMAKIMQRLCKLDYLGAIKGAHGGYYLKNTTPNINLIDFMESIEGPIGIIKCSTDSNCNIYDICNIKTPLNKINENIRNVLTELKINDIITEG
jgi:Rrf2 family protein